MEDGDEGSGGLLVASSDASEVLDLEEEALDEIIAITRDGEAQSVMMRRDQSHPSTLSVASHKPRHAEGGLSSAPVHRT